MILINHNEHEQPTMSVNFVGAFLKLNGCEAWKSALMIWLTGGGFFMTMFGCLDKHLINIVVILSITGLKSVK